VRFPGVSTRYALAPQKGFAGLPDARPSRWRPLASEIMRLLAMAGARELASATWLGVVQAE